MKTLRISLEQQRLELLDGDGLVMAYAVSTSKNGPGERNGS